MADLLTIRNEKKDRKPTFTRSDSHKKVRVGKKWRRARGLQSKVRLMKKGYVRSPKIGWGSPKAVKGMTKDGIMPVVVETVADLDQIKEKEGVVIAATVGTRKKVEILKKAAEKKLTILNVKDPASFIKKVEDKLSKKKQDKQKKSVEKEKKAKEKEAAAKKKEAEDKKEETSDELETKVEEVEKKKQEKKEKDKILTKKDAI